MGNIVGGKLGLVIERSAAMALQRSEVNSVLMAPKDAVATPSTSSSEANMVLEERTTSIVVSPDSHTSLKPSDDAPATTTLFSDLSSSPCFSARIQSLSERRSNFANEVEFEIESSKSHWTEMSKKGDYDSKESSLNGEDHEESNSAAFERLKEHAEWGTFFRRSWYDLEMSEKIAEGGQAEIFAASGTNLRDGTKRDLVVKVFKEGYSLGDLQRLWSSGLAKAALPYRYFLKGLRTHLNETFGLCWAVDVQLLKGDKFAFVFERHWGDLRKLIDMRMRVSNGTPPFSFPTTIRTLLRIAEGMASLHKFGLLHKDLKSANVLVVGEGNSYYNEFNYPAVIVADFESSAGTVGTGFWRAPEVLLALRNCSLEPGTFTHQADVYSYAMTCYEVITGCEPFEGHPLCDYDVVLRGERPALPDDTSPMLVDLVHSCWHEDPFQRPSFQAIQQTLTGLLSSVNAPERTSAFISSCTTGWGALLHEEVPSDLRNFMDQRTLENSQAVPFTLAIMLRFMLQIALGMRKLHRQGIVHGDLKSSNIALHVIRDFPNSRPNFRPNTILVCDSVSVSRFEPSAGAVDSGLWRAPEILKALEKGTLKPETFTAQSDVYSYAMTCYEVTTGKVPFDCHRPSPSHYVAVFRGKRPTLPSWLPPPVANLISQCWHSDPLQRPTFEVISRKLDRLIYCNLPMDL